MSELLLSLRSTAEHPGGALAVWSFCIAAIAFWAGVAHLVTGLSIGIIAVVAAMLAMAAIPFAGRLAYMVWQDQPDG
jgi:hypothetical protein